jgi:hypothetical protein
MSKMRKSKVTAATVSTTVATASRRGSYQKLSTEQKLAIIADRKRHGDNTTVANRMGIKPTYVSAVVTGRKADTKVINKMYDTVRGRKATA